jgi:hypothetical protein
MIKPALDPAAIAAIEVEIERIQTLKPEDVRALWRDTCKNEVPKSLTRDLLIRSLCWCIHTFDQVCIGKRDRVGTFGSVPRDGRV